MPLFLLPVGPPSAIQATVCCVEAETAAPISRPKHTIPGELPFFSRLRESDEYA